MFKKKYLIFSLLGSLVSSCCSIMSILIGSKHRIFTFMSTSGQAIMMVKNCRSCCLKKLYVSMSWTGTNWRNALFCRWEAEEAWSCSPSSSSRLPPLHWTGAFWTFPAAVRDKRLNLRKIGFIFYFFVKQLKRLTVTTPRKHSWFPT